MTSPPIIVLGVTADQSLVLMRGFPEYLRDQGWQVHLVSSPGDNLGALRALEGVTTHPLPMKRNPSPLADFRALLRWVRLLKEISPDVVSVGTPKAGLLGGIAALLCRVPFRVYMLRGLRLESEIGSRRSLLLALERLSAATAHTVLAVSHSLRQRALEIRLARPSKIEVLGEGSSNGVDLDAYSPVPPKHPSLQSFARELGLVEGVPVVGFVGRLSADKGLSALTQARRILHERGVDHQLLLVGGLDSEVDGEVADALIAVGRAAVNTGHVHDTARYYPMMDTLCLPTFREGFPNVVLEAAACAVPTVTTDATGAVDSVVDGVTGLIARVGDGADLADKLQMILRLPESERRQLGTAARARAARDFSRDKVWAQLGTFYAQGAASRKSTR